MSLQPNELEALAHMARLAVHEPDVPHYTRSLTEVLAWVDQIHAVDTDGVQPMANPLDAAQRLRDDVVTETDQRDYFQAIAPAVEAGLYLVPKVIE